MPTYDYTCRKPECETSWEAVVRYEDRDIMSCPTCGSLDIQRHFPSPMVLKASFPDGHKRKGWADFREAAKLNKAKANARPEHKGEYAAEIRKMGVKVEK